MTQEVPLGGNTSPASSLFFVAYDVEWMALLLLLPR